ncbi:AAA family ATPase [Streptomyces sp. N2-109]|uniref:AAA family ATPase n=2 Tax=Streptomyces gossypii TaxID=2883101 RepID=A0ABT2JNF6_9ACTN|nr:AAA family ATPase [Streptomyces gossypii]MCT2589409.1 AAA family ATPase [Streptomyces gossypii]
MAEGAEARVVTGADVSASGADAETLGHQLRSHAKRLLEEPERPLFFGRLDYGSGPASGDHRGQRYYVGRSRITEREAAPPLVIDWRAPVSRAFYQASARAPQGVEVRRRFGWAPWSDGSPEDLTSLEDEHLTGPGTDAGSGSGSGSSDAGSGGSPGSILRSEIERPRVGPMRDIAATIQPEQDDLVRAGLETSLCVQGAPGTGKTAVGLHRAAYLLYTHPRRIQRAGLLILGPNPAFLAYIADVLPSLGESGVRQSTVDEEIARHPVRAVDGETAASVKHDARMARVLRRALYGRVARACGPVEVPDGSYRWRVTTGELARIVAEVRAEQPPYAVGRERVRARVARLLHQQAERRAGPRGGEWLRRMGRARPVSAFVDGVWPKVQPEEILAALLGGAEALAVAADGILKPDEQRALCWAEPPRSWRTARWSAADLVLLDELAGLIERPAGYGHVVVDEAQDLSPMQCRAIARRAGFGSLTVLGDLAQGTTPWAARAWSGHLAHLGIAEAAVIPLSTGFRVPEEILALANRLLGSFPAEFPAARSLRRGGELSLRRIAELAPDTVAAVRAALAREGSIGVIAHGPDVASLREALGAAGIDTTGPGAGELGGAPRVTVLAATEAKGLEYDHVVVVEPAAIVEAEPRGLNRLYVVLTRAVSRLDILHRRPLPAPLTACRAGGGSPEESVRPR